MKASYLVLVLALVSGCASIPKETNSSFSYVKFKNGYVSVVEKLIKPDSVTNLDWDIGLLLRKRITKKNQCLIHSKVYAWLLGDAKVMSNGHHAFVVKDGNIYDSTNMEFTGLPIDSNKVIEFYGKEWKELSKE